MIFQKDYSKLIEEDSYQVFLFYSKASSPFNFAIHPWFVLNKKGELSRWEVIHSNSYNEIMHWGHLYKDRYPLFQGIEKIPFINMFFNISLLLGEVKGSEAQMMIEFI